MAFRREVIDPQVKRRLSLESCNLACVYVVFVDEFNGQCSMRKLHRHLKDRGYKWLPTYEHFRRSWMPQIIETRKKVNYARSIGRVD